MRLDPRQRSKAAKERQFLLFLDDLDDLDDLTATALSPLSLRIAKARQLARKGIMINPITDPEHYLFKEA